MEYIRILTCKAMTTDEIWVRILIYNDCGTEKFLNVFFPVMGEVDKFRELYSKEGDNSSRFKGKTVPWEHL